MDQPLDRRKFLKVAGTSIGVGALFQVAPLLGQSAQGRRSRSFNSPTRMSASPGPPARSSRVE